jgi:hypothetical protein
VFVRSVLGRTVDEGLRQRGFFKARVESMLGRREWTRAERETLEETRRINEDWLTYFSCTNKLERWAALSNPDAFLYLPHDTLNDLERVRLHAGVRTRGATASTKS